MRAMILAGGMSTRLYPLTKEVPKPLVPVAGEPISGHVMRWLASHGFDQVAINVFYLAEKVEAAFGAGSRYGVQLHYLREPRLTGSAGGLKQMEGWFDQTFVVVGCDDLTTADLGAVVRVHRARGALATIGLIEADEVDQYGVVIVDDDGRIREFQEKPPKGTERSNLVNTGIYVFEPEIFTRIPASTFYDFGKQVFPELLADGLPFYGVTLDGAYWRDIGTPDEYRRANEDVLTGRVRIAGARATGIAPTADVASDARIEGPVRIGDSARIKSGARIAGPSVIGDDVVVGEGAVLERTIVWNGATIGPGAIVRDTIVGEGYTVTEGAKLVDTIVANEPAPSA